MYWLAAHIAHFVSMLIDSLKDLLRACVCAHVPLFSEVDDLAQYLDQLLSIPKHSEKISSHKGGLNRFRALARKTREMVSLVHKARELDIHSELRAFYSMLSVVLWRTIYLFFFLKCISDKPHTHSHHLGIMTMFP